MTRPPTTMQRDIIKAVLKAVSDVTGTPREVLVGEGRSQTNAEGRQMATYILVTDYGVQQKLIKEAFNRHHSTISTSVQVAAERYKNYPEWREVTDAIRVRARDLVDRIPLVPNRRFSRVACGTWEEAMAVAAAIVAFGSPWAVDPRVVQSSTGWDVKYKHLIQKPVYQILDPDTHQIS